MKAEQGGGALAAIYSDPQSMQIIAFPLAAMIRTQEAMPRIMMQLNCRTQQRWGCCPNAASFNESHQEKLCFKGWGVNRAPENRGQGVGISRATANGQS